MKYEENVWYGWNGGECPVHPETVVECLFDGCNDCEIFEAHNFCWSHEKIGAVIAAFRVIKEHREPREWHVAVNSKGQVMGCNEWHPTSSLAEELGKYTLVKVREVIE